MVILGVSLSAPRTAAAVLVDGQLVAASAEDRFSRILDDARSVPERAIAFCLERVRHRAGRGDVDRVAVVGESGSPASQQAARRQLEALAHVDPGHVIVVDRWRAHAANAFLTSPFDTAGVIVIDGSFDEAMTATGFGHGASVGLEAFARQPIDAAALARIATDLSRHCGSTRLCLSGKLAADTRALAHGLRHASVTDVHVPAAVESDGLALGATLHAWHAVLGQPRSFVMEHPFWGDSIAAAAAVDTANASGLTSVQCDEEELVTRVAALLALGHIVGWAQEDAEWGPRALGHRSIVASAALVEAHARIRAVADRMGEGPSSVSLAIPGPFLGDLVEMDRPSDTLAARFGALAMRLRPTEDGPLLPQIAPGDVMPVQAIDRDTNPRLFAVADRLGIEGGVPALLQVPLRSASEPLATSAPDALTAFRALGLDALVLDRVVILP